MQHNHKYILYINKYKTDFSVTKGEMFWMFPETSVNNKYLFLFPIVSQKS